MKQFTYFSLPVVLVSVLCFTASSSAKLTSNFTTDPINWVCPENYDGVVRHPYNCQLFFHCNSTGTHLPLRCPDGLYFNPVTEYCDYPLNVDDCHGDTPTPTTSTTPIPRGDPIDWVCPEDYKGLIRHPYFCQSFYLCNVHGTPYSLDCSSGLYFNPETKRCDFPDNVSDCQGGSPPPTSTTQHSSTPSDPIEWVCPGDYQGLIRHPYNCQLFYLCNVDPTPYLLECPRRLHFNPNTESCEATGNIPDCEGGSPPPLTPTPRSTIDFN